VYEKSSNDAHSHLEAIGELKMNNHAAAGKENYHSFYNF
jgi:hypothetical protein